MAQSRKRWRSLASVGNFLTSVEPVSFSRRALLHEVSQKRIVGNCIMSFMVVRLAKYYSRDQIAEV